MKKPIFSPLENLIRHRLRDRLRYKSEKRKSDCAKRSKNYREKNREKCLNDKKKWQQDNWAYRQKYIKQYISKNATKLKAKKRAKYLEKKDDILRKQKRYVANLPPKVKEARRIKRNLTSSRYRRNHLGKYVAHAANRRALKLKRTFNAKQIADWIESVKSSPAVTCYYCKNVVAGIECHIDHIFPLSRGGAHSIENLCVSCSKCNLSKNDSLLTEWFPGNQPFLAL